MEEKKWIIINYNLPTEPSRHRVAIWRALKKAGAVNIQQSMWILPESQSNNVIFNKIAKEIEAGSGESLIMESRFSDPSHEARVINLFNTVRDEEYGEFISECEKYLKEIEKEIAIKKFTYAELEEEEEEMQKLIAWYGKIADRDTFQAPRAKAAEGMIEKIEGAFEGFGNLVYENIELSKRL